MAEEPPVFIVNVASDPVCLSVQGRASYLNSAPVRKFFDTMVAKGQHRFIVDFTSCSNMDSTFLGILAGAALELKKSSTNGELILCGLAQRNLELVKNLGLDRIMRVASGPAGTDGVGGDSLESASVEKHTILKAHADLIETDPSNKQKFEDVVSFLKKQIEQG